MKSSFEFNYEVIRTKRRTICIEITKRAEVIVRAPFSASDRLIDEFVKKHEGWILKHLDNVKKRQFTVPSLDKSEILSIKIKAEEIISNKVRYYSKLMNLYPSAVKITSAKRRFGSCSAKNSLCFSYMLMFYPDEAVDYVVVHELAHIKYKNHGKHFYGLIEKYLPDYRERARLLKY